MTHTDDALPRAKPWERGGRWDRCRCHHSMTNHAIKGERRTWCRTKNCPCVQYVFGALPLVDVQS